MLFQTYRVNSMKSILTFVVLCLTAFHANSEENNHHAQLIDEIKSVEAEVNELYQSGKITETLYITSASVISSVIYGVLHDQITTRICLEYYMTGNHPRLLNTNSPTLHGLVWGVIATWWVGLGLGIPQHYFLSWVTGPVYQFKIYFLHSFISFL